MEQQRHPLACLLTRACLVLLPSLHHQDATKGKQAARASAVTQAKGAGDENLAKKAPQEVESLPQDNAPDAVNPDASLISNMLDPEGGRGAFRGGLRISWSGLPWHGMLGTAWPLHAREPASKEKAWSCAIIRYEHQ